MKLVAINTIFKGGEPIKPGGKFELDDDEGKVIVAGGFAREDFEDKPKETAAQKKAREKAEAAAAAEQAAAAEAAAKAAAEAEAAAKAAAEAEAAAKAAAEAGAGGN